MKSVKPGRGPSMMNAVIGIAVALFGVFWTVMAISGGAWIMAPFGIIFVVIAIVQVIYNFKNATGKNRYSEFDITDSDEEHDPFNEKFGYGYNEEKMKVFPKASFVPTAEQGSEMALNFVTTAVKSCRK